MNKVFTIFYTFYCDSDVRRKYIEICLKTLFDEGEENEYQILVVDGSPLKDFEKNRNIFRNCKNVMYFHDEEENPFKRCIKYFSHIKTEYVLRLLEDVGFNNNKNSFLSLVGEDVEILKNLPAIDVVKYLVVNDCSYRLSGSDLLYEPLGLKYMKFHTFKGRKYYDLSQVGWLYHYFCHNLLYRKSLMERQWLYLADRYLTHNSAEAGNMNIRLYSAVSNIRYIRGCVRLLIRFYEKIFHSDEIIKSVVLTETVDKCDVLHIGYSRVEKRNLFNTNNAHELKNLRIFGDIEFLDKIKFKRIV